MLGQFTLQSENYASLRVQGRRKEREKERRRVHEAKCAEEDAARDAIAAALPALVARALGVAVPVAPDDLPQIRPVAAGATAPLPDLDLRCWLLSYLLVYLPQDGPASACTTAPLSDLCLTFLEGFTVYRQSGQPLQVH